MKKSQDEAIYTMRNGGQGKKLRGWNGCEDLEEELYVLTEAVQKHEQGSTSFGSL